MADPEASVSGSLSTEFVARGGNLQCKTTVRAIPIPTCIEPRRPELLISTSIYMLMAVTRRTGSSVIEVISIEYCHTGLGKAGLSGMRAGPRLRCREFACRLVWCPLSPSATRVGARWDARRQPVAEPPSARTTAQNDNCE